jgi:hypothetical protein
VLEITAYISVDVPTPYMFRRGTARFYAFDLLWPNGEDLRLLPLIEREQRLRELVPHADMSLLYCDHLEADGIALFEQVCSHDLEGIVAKRKDGAYLPENEADWLKIRNRNYSQWIGREELFERERKSDPVADAGVWSACVLACEAAPRETKRRARTDPGQLSFVHVNQAHQIREVAAQSRRTGRAAR